MQIVRRCGFILNALLCLFNAFDLLHGCAGNRDASAPLTDMPVLVPVFVRRNDQWSLLPTPNADKLSKALPQQSIFGKLTADRQLQSAGKTADKQNQRQFKQRWYLGKRFAIP
ncbi:hypothetical protein BV898_15799 [Hypsibius exemplaris]|uniref:Uncharacterized protein n=1 Tax=Hypsibius exemplaris TaxID=2072580 RepID=A0A9X6NC21_HYPEX|nr:hypothetical protein BV898_15799 [Hypsibius exemplaris]